MLTQIERELLIVARERIRIGWNRYICMAIQDAARWNNNVSPFSHQLNFLPYREKHRAARRLINYISGQLGTSTTLEGWKRKHGKRCNNVKRDRLAWIDWMLEGE